MKVLIVDDSPAMRSYVSRTLQAAGLDIANTLEAGDGGEAMSILDKLYSGGGSLDLIFTDLNMPGVGGEAFLGHLRRHAAYEKIPVLVISTDTTQTRVLRIREMGAQGYISKPCPPKLIRAKVEQVLGKAHG